VINRYLVVSAVAMTIFAAFSLGGWSVLKAGVLKRVWAVGAAAIVILGAAWTASVFHYEHIEWELRTRQLVHADLVSLLNDPAVRAARRCGPISVPNHKLIPDARYLLDGDTVLPRTRMPNAGQDARGAAIFVGGGWRFLKHPAYGPFDQLKDNPLIQVPGPGFKRVAKGRYLSAYVNCP
jgi:hypothetical protein